MADVTFTEQEARQGYAMRNGTKHYCCYGMYCDVGHSEDCLYFWKAKNAARKAAGSAATDGVSAADGEPFSRDTPTAEQDEPNTEGRG